MGTGIYCGRGTKSMCYGVCTCLWVDPSWQVEAHPLSGHEPAVDGCANHSTQETGMQLVAYPLACNCSASPPSILARFVAGSGGGSMDRCSGPEGTVADQGRVRSGMMGKWSGLMT